MTTKSNRSNGSANQSVGNSVYAALIERPIQRLYLEPLRGKTDTLTVRQQKSIRRQAVIGWLQTGLLLIVVVQMLFAGLLRALPPDLRVSLAFLHRIEWAAYFGVVLIVAHVAVAGWSPGAAPTVLTNRFYLLAWRFGVPRLVTGRTAWLLLVVYLAVAVLMIAAIMWVRARGFIVQPAR